MTDSEFMKGYELYDETSVVAKLRNADFVKINGRNRTIHVLSGSPVGMKTWGKIDFLRKECGYSFSFQSSDEFNGHVVDFDNRSGISKRQKREMKDNAARERKQRLRNRRADSSKD